MSQFREFTFPSSDGRTEIYVREFVPDGEIKGTVQIAHGVAEHCRRYDDFMRFLADNGYVAAANDHLGHGKSIVTEDDLGFFAEENGWDRVTDDMRTLAEIQREKYPDARRVLFGHSMGSFLARTYIIKYPEEFDAAIICGTGQQIGMIVSFGNLLANNKCQKKGPRYHSQSLQDTAFAGYNRGFKPPRTPYDWLSRNEENVDRYIEDPLCGGTSSVGLFRDMFGGILFVSDVENLKKMNKSLPVLFIAGSMDPVGECGKGVQRIFGMFKDAGMKDISIKLYDGDRHEILNEADKDAVYADVLDFINAKL